LSDAAKGRHGPPFSRGGAFYRVVFACFVLLIVSYLKYIPASGAPNVENTLFRRSRGQSTQDEEVRFEAFIRAFALNLTDTNASVDSSTKLKINAPLLTRTVPTRTLASFPTCISITALLVKPNLWPLLFWHAGLAFCLARLVLPRATFSAST
jgi:hypothetical protein